MQITFDSTNPAEVAAVHAATSELVRRTATDWKLPAPEAKILAEVVKADPEPEAQSQEDHETASEILQAVDTDSTGAEWNAELHASTKTKNADGTWKKRRGSAAAAPDPLPDPEPTRQALNAIAPTPPAPPAPPSAPAAEDDPFVKIMALLTGQAATVTQAKEAAQRQGLKDLGDLRVNGTLEQKLAVLRELEGE